VPVSASVTGSYKADSTWSDGFTGSVTLTNAAGAASAWRVTLTFPAAVTGNTQFWSNAATAPTRSVSGQTWTFTGTGPIPGGGSVVLGFQFAKDPTAQNAATFAPTSCTVNARPCGAP
jgi:cellulase/cellobiase CelA1